MLTEQNCPGIDTARRAFTEVLHNEKFGEKLGYLWSRWQDEREYEDFEEYIKVARTDLEALSPCLKLKRMTKRPFALHMQHASCDKAVFELRVTGRGLSLVSKPA